MGPREVGSPFVDLAGNERLKRSKDSDPRETGAINRSLQALGKVISILSRKDSDEHVPYRDSTLTKLLMDSLGGDAAMLMVACASPPAAAHVDETLCTLGYARRARGIVNAPFATLVGADTGLERRQAERDRNEIEKTKEDVARLPRRICGCRRRTRGCYHSKPSRKTVMMTTTR